MTAASSALPWAFFALIALVVAGVVGTVVVKRGLGGAKAPAVAAAPAAAVADDGASVRVENGVVKFYFATGKADLAAPTRPGRHRQGRGRRPEGRGIGLP
jgi:hypothetical protein